MKPLLVQPCWFHLHHLLTQSVQNWIWKMQNLAFTSECFEEFSVVACFRLFFFSLHTVLVKRIKFLTNNRREIELVFLLYIRCHRRGIMDSGSKIKKNNEKWKCYFLASSILPVCMYRWLSNGPRICSIETIQYDADRHVYMNVHFKKVLRYIFVVVIWMLLPGSLKSILWSFEMLNEGEPIKCYFMDSVISQFVTMHQQQKKKRCKKFSFPVDSHTVNAQRTFYINFYMRRSYLLWMFNFHLRFTSFRSFLYTDEWNINCFSFTMFSGIQLTDVLNDIKNISSTTWSTSYFTIHNFPFALVGLLCLYFNVL